MRVIYMKYRSARAERLENRKKRIAAAQLLQRKIDTYQKLLLEDPVKLERFQGDEIEDTYMRFVGWKVHEDEKTQKAEWDHFKQKEYNYDSERIVDHAVLTNAAPKLVLE